MAESFGFDDASAMILEGRQIIEQQQQAALMAEQGAAPGEAGVAGSEAEMIAAQLGAEAPQ
jgi:hypothetical protein